MYLTDKLSTILDDQASRFTDKLFEAWDDYKTTSKQSKTKKRKVCILVMANFECLNYLFIFNCNC